MSQNTQGELESQYNELINLLKTAYASGQKFQIQIAEGELLIFGAWVDERGHFQPPWTDPSR